MITIVTVDTDPNLFAFSFFFDFPEFHDDTIENERQLANLTKFV